MDKPNYESIESEEDLASPRLLWCLLPQTLVCLVSCLIPRWNHEPGTLAELSIVSSSLSQAVIIGCWLGLWRGIVVTPVLCFSVWVFVHGIIHQMAPESKSRGVDVGFIIVTVSFTLPPILLFGVLRLFVGFRLSKIDHVTFPKLQFGIRHLMLAMTVVSVGISVLFWVQDTMWRFGILGVIVMICGIIPSAVATLVFNRRRSVFSGIMVAILIAVLSASIGMWIIHRDGHYFEQQLSGQIITSLLASLQTLLTTYLLRRAGYRLTIKSLT